MMSTFYNTSEFHAKTPVTTHVIKLYFCSLFLSHPVCLRLRNLIIKSKLDIRESVMFLGHSVFDIFKIQIKYTIFKKKVSIHDSN